MRRVLLPISYVCNLVVRFFIRGTPEVNRSDEEILILAERGAQQGTLTKSESSIIANALSLDNVRVGAIMTPRTVITALRRDATVGEVFREFPSLPFGRTPVFGRNIDDVVGLVRRRDLLKTKANDQDSVPVEQLMGESALYTRDGRGRPSAPPVPQSAHRKFWSLAGTSLAPHSACLLWRTSLNTSSEREIFGEGRRSRRHARAGALTATTERETATEEQNPKLTRVSPCYSPIGFTTSVRS